MMILNPLRRGALVPNLRAIREGKGMSRQALATRIGVDFSFIWRLEEGKSGAGYSTLRALVEALETTEEQLTCQN